MLQRLASKCDEARLEDFKASLRNDFVGDGSEFVVLDELARMNAPMHVIMEHPMDNVRALPLTDVFVRGDCYSLCTSMTIL